MSSPASTILTANCRRPGLAPTASIGFISAVWGLQRSDASPNHTSAAGAGAAVTGPTRRTATPPSASVKHSQRW